MECEEVANRFRRMDLKELWTPFFLERTVYERLKANTDLESYKPLASTDSISVGSMLQVQSV
jgi:hypothetical protein